MCNDRSHFSDFSCYESSEIVIDNVFMIAIMIECMDFMQAF